MSTEIYYDYNSTSSAWYPSSKYEYTYNADGNMSTEFYYGYNSTSSAWVLSYKSEYIYDTDGNMVTYTNYDYDSTSGVWGSSFKIENIYDTDGNMVTYTNYDYNLTTSTWDPSFKEELTYDLSISINDIIVPASWYSYSFFKNKPLGTIDYEWDTLSSTWVSSKSYTLYYSSFKVPVIKYLVASAKPFSIEKKSDNIRINFNSVAPVNVSLCDASGRRLVCKNIKSGEFIDISDLAPGFYILGISRNDGIARSCCILKE
jgi:hypothetical protein